MHAYGAYICMHIITPTGNAQLRVYKIFRVVGISSLRNYCAQCVKTLIVSTVCYNYYVHDITWSHVTNLLQVNWGCIYLGCMYIECVR